MKRRSVSTTSTRRPRPFRPRLDVLEDRCLLSGDAVLRWNAVALDAIKQDNALGVPHEQPGPTGASRALAIVHAAIYDAVNSIDGSYTPYLIDDVNASPTASIDAAVAQAGHDTLAALFPSQKTTLDADLAADLAGIPSGPAQAGIAVAQFVAGRLLAIRQADGSSAKGSYTFGTGPGAYQVDPLHPTQTPLGVAWGNVTPFTLTSSTQFEAPPPPAVNSADYVVAYNEVKSLGGDGIHTPTSRTPEQTLIGLYWGYDGSPGLGTPPRMYNQIAEVIARQQGNSEVQNARFFALINLAMADAGISAWESKYIYNFWRPVTAIRAGDSDGNPDTIGDPNWTPLGAPADDGAGTNFTPPFPAYPSGHATFGAALFRTMADFYGTDNISFTFVSDELNGITIDQIGQTRPLVPRSFDSFSQAMEENAQSRIYLGIHWQFDKTAGISMGESIADYVCQNFLRNQLTPNQQFVSQVYHDLLGRPVDPAGLEGFSAALDQGISRAQVVQLIEHSAEFRGVEIQNLYATLMHRPPDPAGLSAFESFLAQGATVEQVETQLLSSSEYFQSRGGSVASFVTALYQDTLHRAIDPAAQATLIKTLTSGASRAEVAAAVINSLECHADVVDSFYQQFLHRHADAIGLFLFTNDMQQGVRDEEIIATLVSSQEYFARL
jgi:hypothetical protein